MKSDCPYCGTKLSRRLIRSVPAPGERKFLPSQAIQVCPVCHGKLATHVHASEMLLGCLFGVPFVWLMDSRAVLQPVVFLCLSAGLLIIGMVVGLVFHFKYWRHAQRYKPYVPSNAPTRH